MRRVERGAGMMLAGIACEVRQPSQPRLLACLLARCPVGSAWRSAVVHLSFAPTARHRCAVTCAHRIASSIVVSSRLVLRGAPTQRARERAVNRSLSPSRLHVGAAVAGQALSFGRKPPPPHHHHTHTHTHTRSLSPARSSTLRNNHAVLALAGHCTSAVADTDRLARHPWSTAPSRRLDRLRAPRD